MMSPSARTLAPGRERPSRRRLVDARGRDRNGVAVIAKEFAIGRPDIGERERTALGKVRRQERSGRGELGTTVLERCLFALNVEGLRRRSRERAQDRSKSEIFHDIPREPIFRQPKQKIPRNRGKWKAAKGEEWEKKRPHPLQFPKSRSAATNLRRWPDASSTSSPRTGISC